MFIPLKMVSIGIDPSPFDKASLTTLTLQHHDTLPCFFSTETLSEKMTLTKNIFELPESKRSTDARV